MHIMVSKSNVLEHIARTTGLDAKEVGRAVTVEYWKDQISFTSRRGYKLFAKYADALGVKDFEGFGTGVCMKLPKSLFNPEDYEKHFIIAYVSSPYAELLKEEHPEFNFA